MKRKDECLFCNSRSCYSRIFREDYPIYDEIACYRHIEDLEKHSDEILGKNNGVVRTHETSSKKLKRKLR